MYSYFSYRTNQTKYDLVFLEALFFQSYYGLIHYIGSPPVIGILSLEVMWSAAEAMENPTNPAMIPQILLPYGNRMTFYERLQNTLLWLWMRCVKIWRLFIFTGLVKSNELNVLVKACSTNSSLETCCS
jgi:hypothetical protein